MDRNRRHKTHSELCQAKIFLSTQRQIRWPYKRLWFWLIFASTLNWHCNYLAHIIQHYKWQKIKSLALLFKLHSCSFNIRNKTNNTYTCNQSNLPSIHVWSRYQSSNGISIDAYYTKCSTLWSNFQFTASYLWWKIAMEKIVWKLARG